MFSPSTSHKVGRASGSVLGTVLAHVPASVAVDFEAVQFISTRVLSCSIFRDRGQVRFAGVAFFLDHFLTVVVTQLVVAGGRGTF